MMGICRTMECSWEYEVSGSFAIWRRRALDPVPNSIYCARCEYEPHLAGVGVNLYLLLLMKLCYVLVFVVGATHASLLKKIPSASVESRTRVLASQRFP